MEDKIYTIILDDGTSIKNLRMNGNNFVSQEPIDSDLFNRNLGTVVVKDDENNEETHDNAKLFQSASVGDGYYFILLDIPEEELERLKLRSDLDYVLMMADLEV